MVKNSNKACCKRRANSELWICWGGCGNREGCWRGAQEVTGVITSGHNTSNTSTTIQYWPQYFHPNFFSNSTLVFPPSLMQTERQTWVTDRKTKRQDDRKIERSDHTTSIMPSCWGVLSCQRLCTETHSVFQNIKTNQDTRQPQTNGIGVISSSNAHTSLISVGIVVVKKLKLSHWETPKHWGRQSCT